MNKIMGLVGVFLLFLIAGGIFFMHKKNTKEPITLPKPTVTSEVVNIRAIQTNPETGKIEYQISAQSLTQNTDNTSTLHDVLMHWTPTSTDPKLQEQYTISAQNAYLDEKSGDFVFQDGFTFVRQSDQITITGGVLTGNTHKKHIQSQDVLTITQNERQFHAQGFTADLDQKIYDFYRVQMTFSTPIRQDTPLF